jgi:hypothetical protein
MAAGQLGKLSVVQNCPFTLPSDVEIPMYTSTWTATVYDTHSRTVIGSVTVKSPLNPKCPMRMMTASGRKEELYADPDAVEYAAALAELINRTACAGAASSRRG